MQREGVLAFDEALIRLVSQGRAPVKVTTVPLIQAQDRVLAAPVNSTISVPAFDNSAMDGYALRVDDLKSGTDLFTVVQTIAAGHTGQRLDVGQAARIFTGAPIPEGANVVVAQEQTQALGNRVKINSSYDLGQHIRRCGEDILLGSQILQAGIRLEPQHLALLASVGVSQVPVYARLRVGLIWNGDELVEPGEMLLPGKIYNSNRYALSAVLGHCGCEVLDFGTIADSLDITVRKLRQAANECDIVMTCGGVSVGQEDWVKRAVSQLGSLDIWRIAMKPGKPFAHGRIGQSDFIGLPGNPVSAFVTLLVVAMPLLRLRMGLSQINPISRYGVAGFDWRSDSRRREFLRVRHESGESGQPVLSLWPNQGSANLSGLVWADGLVDIEPGTRVRVGDPVRYTSLADLMR